jgi:hypothetical protein
MVFCEDCHSAETLATDVSEAGTRWLDEFRHRIRQVLHLNEKAARFRDLEWRVPADALSESLCVASRDERTGRLR